MSSVMSDREIPHEHLQVASTVLVIPFSELGTKSDVSRGKMLDQLLTNIKHVLKDVFHVPWVKYRVPGERLVFSFKKGELPAAMDALQHVPGILRIYACVETQPRVDAIVKKVGELEDRGSILLKHANLEIRALFFRNKREKESLIHRINSALREKALQQSKSPPGRTGNFPYLSLTYIEVHPEFAYITLERREGLNGNPIGSQNPMIAEIIGRGGDFLAALLTLKRGIIITPVFFSIGKYANNPRRYTEMLISIKRGIDLFHGFPVKKYFFVSLDEVLETLAKQLPELMADHPCTCCILTRRAVISAIISRNSMVNFAIQGTAHLPNDIGLDSCPLEIALDPALNTEGLFIVTPLLAGTLDLPPIFSHQLATLPELADATNGYTWNFCRLRRNEKKVKLGLEERESITRLVNNIMNTKENIAVLFDAEIPGV